MKRYSVLTYIINNYEQVHEIEQCDPEAEYILVTDDKSLVSQTWQVVYDADLEGMSVFDKCYAIRFNCFKYCHTDICIRIDGSIGVRQSLKPLVDVFERGGYDACLMPHPLRDNFEDEYAIWVEQRGYDASQAKRCLDYMQREGYDFHYKGLFQCCFSIQRRGEITDEIDRMSLHVLKELGKDGEIERLDQVPVSFIINSRFQKIKILPVSCQILRSPYLQWYWHNSEEYNLNCLPDMTKKDIRYMFNRPVECMYLLPETIERKNMIKREGELLRKIYELQEGKKQLESKIQYECDKNRKHMRVMRLLMWVSVFLFFLLMLMIVQTVII